MTDLEAVAMITDEQLGDIDRALVEKGRHVFELEINLYDKDREDVAVATAVYHAAKQK